MLCFGPHFMQATQVHVVSVSLLPFPAPRSASQGSLSRSLHQLRPDVVCQLYIPLLARVALSLIRTTSRCRPMSLSRDSVGDSSQARLVHW